MSSEAFFWIFQEHDGYWFVRGDRIGGIALWFWVA